MNRPIFFLLIIITLLLALLKSTNAREIRNPCEIQIKTSALKIKKFLEDYDCYVDSKSDQPYCFKRDGKPRLMAAPKNETEEGNSI